MTDDLRSQVARRLCEAFNAEADRLNRNPEEWRHDDPNRDLLVLWKAVASESIRIAEWARRRSPWVSDAEWDRGPLTLPDEGWKP